MADDKPHPDDEDDGEYELEPIDPAILEHERRRAAEKTRRAEASVDINAAYESVDAPDSISLDDLRGFRFSVRHLMIGTAVLALFLTLARRGCIVLFLGVVTALAAGWYFVLRKERRERLEREQSLAGNRSEPQDDVAEGLSPFKLAFSVQQLLAAITVAAVVFGMVRLFGGPEHAAHLLGTIALVGLAVHLFGFEPPPIFVLGWWVLLVLYIVVSLTAVIATNM